MLGLALKLLGFGKMLMNWIADGIKWLLEKPYRAIIAVLAVLSAFLLWQAGNIAEERDTWRTAAQDWKKALKQTEVNYRKASAKALAEAEENKVRVETKYVEIENEADKSIRARLDAALASLRARSNRTDTGSSDTIGLPINPDSTVNPDGTSTEPIMDDATICTTNTIKAQGWQDWYRQVSAVERTPE